MRILFVTDSLGAPRNEPEVCMLDDIWCYKVSKKMKGIEPIYYNQNGLDTNGLRSQTNKKLPLYNPDIVFLQIGIVDCAPRALKKIETSIVIRLGFIGKLIHRIIKRNYAGITKFRNTAYVTPEKFEENLIFFKEKFHDIPVYVVAIGAPCGKYIEKSPLIKKRQEKYNQILYTVFGDKYINPYENLNDEQLENIYMSDLHHLNAEGHNLVTSAVVGKLNEDFIKNNFIENY